MKQLRRLRPTPAMVVACIALTVALGGTSVAAINALPRNSVGAKQLKKNAVTAPKIKANAVSGAKVANDSITGADVNEGSLGTVPSATNAANATNATNAATAANANALNGLAANALTRGAGSSTGATNVPTSSTAIASVTITAPAAGYVLVTSTAGPNATAGCPCRYVQQVQDPTSGDLSQFTVDTVAVGGFGDGYDGGVASTHLFAVTAGSRTFNTLAYHYGAGTVVAATDMTALWIPFGAAGGAGPALPHRAQSAPAPGS